MFILNAVTAFLDTPGVHPGAKWDEVADEIFAEFRKGWSEDDKAILWRVFNNLHIYDEALFQEAMQRYDMALSGRPTEVPSPQNLSKWQRFKAWSDRTFDWPGSKKVQQA